MSWGGRRRCRATHTKTGVRSAVVAVEVTLIIAPFARLRALAGRGGATLIRPPSEQA
jgi:hypothetical protein